MTDAVPKPIEERSAGARTQQSRTRWLLRAATNPLLLLVLVPLLLLHADWATRATSGRPYFLTVPASGFVEYLEARAIRIQRRRVMVSPRIADTYLAYKTGAGSFALISEHYATQSHFDRLIGQYRVGVTQPSQANGLYAPTSFTHVVPLKYFLYDTPDAPFGNTADQADRQYERLLDSVIADRGIDLRTYAASPRARYNVAQGASLYPLHDLHTGWTRTLTGPTEPNPIGYLHNLGALLGWAWVGLIVWTTARRLRPAP